MTRYAVLLRGVNVGGVNLKMADVAAALTGAGFGDVRTVLASGNVLLDATGDATGVRAAAEAALRERCGYRAWVLVYDVDTVRAIVAAYPFEPERPGYHSYVTFVSDAAVLAELAALAGPDGPAALGDGVLYWQVPQGDTLDSAVGKALARKRYAPAVTTRNVRTLNRLLR